MTSAALETLRAARELISDPAKWTQGTLAKDLAGNGVWPTDETAVCFCASGAVGHVSVKANGFTDKGWVEAFSHLDALTKDGRSFTLYNDTHTHAEVLAMFDKAIATLEETNE